MLHYGRPLARGIALALFVQESSENCLVLAKVASGDLTDAHTSVYYRERCWTQTTNTTTTCSRGGKPAETNTVNLGYRGYKERIVIWV